ncbi:MAG TPA: AAA-like domain-containing protein, partial [Stenomitos sp.]
MSTSPNEFFNTGGGNLDAKAPSYVSRKADDELYDGLSRAEYCFVLTSRQMGKSSLAIRTAARLRAEETAVAQLDLTYTGQALDSEQWYYGLLFSLGEQLDLLGELVEFWESHQG